jgi:hypothetical protein
MNHLAGFNPEVLALVRGNLADASLAELLHLWRMGQARPARDHIDQAIFTMIHEEVRTRCQ